MSADLETHWQVEDQLRGHQLEIRRLQERVRALEAENLLLSRTVIGYERELCEAGTRVAVAQHARAAAIEEALGQERLGYLRCVGEVIDDAIAEDRGRRGKR